jgi:hypothetical protein
MDTISILAILTNTIRYRYGIDTSGIEAEPVFVKYADPWIEISCSIPCKSPELRLNP